MRKLVGTIFWVIAALFVIVTLVSVGGFLSMFQTQHQKVVGKPSLLYLELDGIILDGKEFAENLVKYGSDPNIKGVLIRINSPGGVVGPSQEIYSEIKRVREELKKPVVVSGIGLMASGAYYAAVGADKIVVNPGTLMGSIGVIMEFVNLENLYSWAKIKRYVIKTGTYKDAGADYRAMSEEERALFLGLMNEVLEQFKTAVAKGRKLSMEAVTASADGRIFNGETAVKLGFADQLGTLEDAKRLLLKMTKLPKNTELFSPPKKRPDFFEMLAEVKTPLSMGQQLENFQQKVLPMDLMNQPLYIWPHFLKH